MTGFGDRKYDWNYELTMVIGLTDQVWFHPSGNWSIAFLIIGSIVAAFALYRLRFGYQSRIQRPVRLVMFALRLLTIILVALSLINWMQNKVVTQPAEIVVVFDKSKSGAHIDSALAVTREKLHQLGLGEPTRFNTGKIVFLENNLDQIKYLEKRYRPRFAAIGETTEHFNSSSGRKIEQWLQHKQPIDEQSRIGDALQEVLRFQAGRSTAAIVCLTDGINTHGQSIEEAARYAKLAGIPLFFIGWGETNPPIDLSVGELKYTKKLFVDDIFQITARFSAVDLEGEKVVVRLIDKETDQIVDSIEVEITGQYFETNVQLSAIAKIPGLRTYRVEVVPHENEVALDNNVVEAQINVRDDVIRVLLLQNYPSSEFRFLKGLLSRQRTDDDLKKTFEIRTLMQQAEPRHPETDQFELLNFPDTLDELAEYDVIVMGDVKRGDSFSRSHLNDTQLELIRDFVVERSGRLIFVGGPKFMPRDYFDSPLDRLLPFDKNKDSVGLVVERTDPVGIMPTDLASSFPPFLFSVDGQQNERILAQLPDVNWWQQLPKLSYGTIVLAETDAGDSSNSEKHPVLTYQVVNSGRVVYQATDEIYKWRMLAGDRYYGRYWMQLIRFMCRRNDENVGNGAVSVDKEVFIENESINLTVELPTSLLANRKASNSSDSVELILYRDEQPVRKITLTGRRQLDGAYIGKIQGLTPGNYRVQLINSASVSIDMGATFQVNSVNHETINLVLQEAILRESAEKTGGEYFHISEISQLWDALPLGDATVVQKMPPRSAWVDSRVGLGFALTAIALLTTEWIIRKRNGLV